MKYNIECLRLIAVVLITFIHTRHSFENIDLPYIEKIFIYVIEKLPKIGTLTLSLMSGYLYWLTSRHKKSIIKKKIKTLAIPFLVANGLVILLNLISFYVFGYNFLNRLAYDYTLFTDGLLSLNSPPINPPTYFVRDIFIIFCLIELIRNKNLKMLLILVPYVVFGKLLIRYDILLLFAFGVLFAQFESVAKKYNLYLIGLLLILGVISIIFSEIHTYKYPLAFLVFMIFLNIKISFVNVGGFAYLLHLYHSPIIVVIFPLLATVISNSYLSVVLQIMSAIIFCAVLFLLTNKLKFLKILSGGR
ncbi:hypothetical protein SDC9_30177 [bioreactor metagenome]|uniref:Acyltransferase 3 domain-containing protein n=1 Tax=bioreactor metagenome TaxID=1076179 RepID=A0A644UZY3_9ZZZZ|nr:hypothetical protein [Paludibacter sp.]